MKHEEGSTSYDRVHYPGYPFPQAHVDRMAMLATLFGMTPAPPGACRMLELGCGDGGNLIPQAAGLPESTFVGIDLSASAVARGRSMLASLGLENVSLYRRDITDAAGDFGVFDYIVAHGLYSWVPPEVRDRILDICNNQLAPHGVAYVSYNTYPGCHIRQMVREMMRYHIRTLPVPERKIEQARALLEFISAGRPDPGDYAALIRNELNRLKEYSDEALYHDDLSEINEPVFFSQFMEHAGRHGLQYLAEADFYEMQDYGFPSQVTELLRGLSKDVVMKEQYMDFIKGRYFRRTLLCREAVQLNRAPKPESMTCFAFASPLRSAAENLDLSAGVPEEFRDARGRSLKTDNSLAKAAFLCLSGIWPRSIFFRELVDAARERLCTTQSSDRAATAGEDSALAEILLKTYAANMVEVHLHRPQFVTALSERPVASPLSRLQATNGDLITTQRHTNIQVEDLFTRCLITLLDGSRSRTELLRELAQRVERGEISAARKGSSPDEDEDAMQSVQVKLEAKLSMLAKFAILVA